MLHFILFSAIAFPFDENWNYLHGYTHGFGSVGLAIFDPED